MPIQSLVWSCEPSSALYLRVHQSPTSDPIASFFVVVPVHVQMKNINLLFISSNFWTQLREELNVVLMQDTWAALMDAHLMGTSHYDCQVKMAVDKSLKKTR
jgi:hypothetical protein